MDKKCKLTVLDEVNIKFEGLDPKTRARMIRECEYYVPYARHTPAGKLGRWDGRISFMNMGGSTYYHLLDKLFPILEEEKYYIDLEDKRLFQNDFVFDEIDDQFFSYVHFPPGHFKECEPVILRPHQVTAVNEYLKNRHGTEVISTGGGKTLITAALSKCVEKYGRSIVIVPSKDLVTQTEADYKLVGLDVGVYFGDRKELNKKHTICTWQSLVALWRREKNDKLNITDVDIQEFTKDVVCIMCDEAHTIKGPELKQFLGQGVMANIPLRWGMTGTIPKDEIEALHIRCNIGDIVHRVRAAELQELGVLSKCDISIYQLASKLKFSNYHDEMNWLVTNKDRMRYISGLIDDISLSGNTLVLVNNIETGELLREYLGLEKDLFVSGSTVKNKRKEQYDSIDGSTNKILIATYGVCSTGISINRIFNVVLVEAGKSFVKVIQSIGRGLRMAKDKDSVTIFDICGSNKYSAKHMRERIKFYNEAEYPHTTTKINDWENK